MNSASKGFKMNREMNRLIGHFSLYVRRDTRWRQRIITREIKININPPAWSFITIIVLSGTVFVVDQFTFIHSFLFTAKNE